jgi:hypothetical protein
MRILGCLALLLVATAAEAQTFSTVVNRGTNAVTVTAPAGAATITRVAQTSTGVTITTTFARARRTGYQPMGSGGYRPMGSAGYHPTGF